VFIEHWVGYSKNAACTSSHHFSIGWIPALLAESPGARCAKNATAMAVEKTHLSSFAKVRQRSV
jgi:hypothetical protein